MASGSFKYSSNIEYDFQLDVEDFGNCAIRATDVGLLQDMYFISKTILGISYILIAGPYVIDQNRPADKCTISYAKFDYDEHKLKNAIDKMLNYTKGLNISQAVVIPIDEAIDNCINLADYMRG